MKTARWIALAFLAAGGALLARSLYLRGKALLASLLIRQAWADTLRTGRPTPPWPWADTHPIGRLRIPRIGYEELVLEGASPRNLAFGPARMMNAAAPGEGGNIVLAGHRTSWFLPLKEVRVGDEVELRWRDRVSGRETGAGYRVTQVVVVDPGDRRFLAPTGEDVLTLITCYPFGSAPTSPQRYVVRASPGPHHVGFRLTMSNTIVRPRPAFSSPVG
jgi:sortase A